MSYVEALTIFHTGLSLAAIAAGIPAVVGLFAPSLRGWISPFLALAVATSVTGYFFPFSVVTPAVIVGAIALLVLATVYYAARRLGGSPIWRGIYAGGVVASLYLLVLVAIAQAFLKIDPLARLAPNQTEPPFAIAQFVAITAFLAIGFIATRRFSAAPVRDPA
ncbi:hypothetical protein [Stappia indica]|uniref:hypothetical protein n=1 Tax=Stappia indica TaxID=538381 RepID=UPI0008337E14|nr:hypothetical protein [Stappia indica]